MRSTLIGLALLLSVLAGSVAIVSARQQATPGMSPARFWINNRTRDEAIPVSIANVDPKAPPVPVIVDSFALVDFTDHAKATLYDIQSRPQSVEQRRQQWEYREIRFGAGDDRVTALNQAGALGWEATGIAFESPGVSTVLLKRPR